MDAIKFHTMAIYYNTTAKIMYFQYRKIQDLIKELSIPVPGTKDLSFPTKYSQNFATQCIANFWKQYWSFWRNPGYNTTRILMTILVGLLFGTMFWNKGGKT